MMKYSKNIEDKEALEHSFALMLLETINDDGNRGYAYVSVRMSVFEEFNKRINGTDRFELADYCGILASGNAKPTDEIMQEMEDNWGFQHDAENNIIIKELNRA